MKKGIIVYSLRIVIKTATLKVYNMEFNVTVLGSGSSGNSILISNGNDGILIDAGFSRKEILSRLDASGLSPDIVKAILITHEHLDHVKGARVLADYLDIPTYVTPGTAKYLSEKNYLGKKKVLFEAGTEFNLLDFKVQPFCVSHDAIDPVGFIIAVGDIKVGLAMDLGHLDRLTKCRLKGCNVIILESNHDTQLLRTSSRPLRLIRRIAGKFGHLSNEAAISSLPDLLTENSQFLFLGHISSECNNPEIVEEMAKSRLKEIERTDIILSIMKQEAPLETISI